MTRVVDLHAPDSDFGCPKYYKCINMYPKRKFVRPKYEKVIIADVSSKTLIWIRTFLLGTLQMNPTVIIVSCVFREYKETPGAE